METLAFLQPEEKIVLISESSLIKTVTNLQAVTQTLTCFDIEESSMNTLSEKYRNVSVIHDRLIEIDASSNIVKTVNQKLIRYKFLCLCMGAKPKLIPQAAANKEFVLGIRDTDSVDVFVNKLNRSKKIAVVGNGGIASELVYKSRNVQIDWIIKDKHIAATFVDPGAAEFFQSALKTGEPAESGPSKRLRYEEAKSYKSGAALGPDWYRRFNIQGADVLPSTVKVHYQTEIVSVSKHAEEGNVEILLGNNQKILCDLIVSATGVQPQTDFKINKNLQVSHENEIKVDEFMRTNIENVYAAGDICCASWEHAENWFQMKLWTQARQMGCCAAKCMSAALNDETIYQDFCFELFTHTTRLFGYKVILIGLYNGQKLDKNYEILFRTTKGVEYVKFVLQNHKLRGAVLIGDTDLEETCENLILNQIDLSLYKEDLLNPNIDIEDYFD